MVCERNLFKCLSTNKIDMKIQEQYRKQIKEFVRRALERYRDEIEEIILFRSVARGDGKEDSDVDILVIWQGDKLEGLGILKDIAMDVLLEYGQLIPTKKRKIN